MYAKNRVISGSLDGKMVITRVSGLSYERKLIIDLREKYVSKTGVCNAVGWSVGGRYAIGALTGKPKTHPKKRVTILVIWDSVEETFWTIPKGNEFELAGNLLGLSVHPKLESIIACGGSNGFVYLINIVTGQILQSFRETGVWSHASEVDADVLECVFSPTGLQFAISTSVGTLSLYGALPAEGFQACPVEQFFKADYMPATEEGALDPVKKLCNARLVEYPYQPAPPNAVDKDFAARLAFYKRELETYQQLEMEVLKELPNVNEERKVMIRDEDPAREEAFQQELQSESDEQDADYVEGESEDLPPGESENEGYLSGTSNEDDLLREARRGRRRRRRRRRISEEEEAAEEMEDEDSEWNGSEEEEESKNRNRRGHRERSSAEIMEDSKAEAKEEDSINLEEEKVSAEKEEAEYHLDPAPMTSTPPLNTTCAFCDKSEGLDSMTGPYVLLRDEDGKKLGEEKLWIHQACLEYNDFIRIEDNSYLGIKEALEKAVFALPVQCARCGGKGCTVKCSNCYKWFHGYGCCNRSGVFLEDTRGKETFRYRCYDCYGDYVIQLVDESHAKKAASQKIKAKLSRDWIHNNTSGFVPQLYDECYYFFQGHEEFLREYFSYFCKTDPPSYPDLPWKRFSQLLEPTLCHVMKISYEFPDPAVVYANKVEFQLSYPPILMRLELLIDGTNDTFEVMYLFQSAEATPAFLIPKEIYETSKEWFHSQWRRIGNREFLTVHTTQGTKVNITAVEDVEPSTFPNSGWRNLVGEEQPEELEQSITLNLRSKKSNFQTVRLSYWEITDWQTEGIPQDHINSELKNVVKNKVEADEDLYGIFVDDPSGITNYLNTVSYPMFYELICERIESGYYRRVEAVAHDVKLITENARTFNSETNPDIVEDANEGCMKVLAEIYRYTVKNGIEVRKDVFEGVDLVEEVPSVQVVDGVSIIIAKDLIQLESRVEVEDERKEEEEPGKLLVKIPRKIAKKQKAKAKRRHKKEDDSDESYREPGIQRKESRISE